MVIIDLNNLLKNANISLLFNFTDAPKNVYAGVVPFRKVIKGQNLTFSCSARGRPYPTFQWFHNGLLVSLQAQWTIRSIIYSQAGNYYCTAQNKHGKEESQSLQINVSCKSVWYLPQFGNFFWKVLPYYLFVLIVKSNRWIKKENYIPPPGFSIDYYLH